MAGALADPVDLEEADYRELHAGRGEGLPAPFEVERLGERDEPAYADIGVEFYRHRAS